MKNPFVGLRPFKPSENNLFFGRDKETSVLRDLVLTLPVLVVYAPSGTGKSSLINAGLIPALREHPAIIDVTISDPRQDPTEVVCAALATTGWASSANGQSSLAHLLEQHYDDTDKRVVIVLDQFEERVKRPGDLDRLYRDIARLANTRSEAATIIISIRDDYIAGLDQLMRRVSGLLDAGYRVPPLSRAALTEAVVRPLAADSNDVTVEPGLVDQVLTDLEVRVNSADPTDKRIEPGYFQVVWQRLWEADATKSRRTLTRRTYRGEGGAGQILKSFVNRILADLLPYEAALLDAALRYLVLPTGAKVPLTIDDLLGLVRRDDLSFGFDGLLADRPRGPHSAPTRHSPSPQLRANAADVFRSLFDQLTRAEAPLFRRVQRGGREEFELVHDLLGDILNEWRRSYDIELNSWYKELVHDGSKRTNSGMLDEAIEFIGQLYADLLARNWESISYTESTGRLTYYLQRLGSKAWTNNKVSYRKLITLLRNVAELLANGVDSGASRQAKRMCQMLSWQLTQVDLSTPYSADSPGFPHELITGIIAGTVFSGSGSALAIWISGLLSFLPTVAYLPLTYGMAAAGAILLYLVGYTDSADSTKWVDSRALLDVVLPISSELEAKRKSNRASFRKTWYYYTSIALWWPVIFFVFGALCFSGAAVFHLLGWSPTAGFNFTAVFAAIGITIGYLVVIDF